MVKKITLLMMAAAFAMTIAGCHTGQKKMSKEAGEKMMAKKNIVLSGKTGGIVGTPEDNRPTRNINPATGYPVRCTRDRWIMAAREGKLKVSPETLKLLESRKNLTISSKTGEIVGSKADKKPKKVKCKYCGFPEGSLRQRIIIMEEL